MRSAVGFKSQSAIAIVLAIAVGGCSKLTPNDPQELAKVEARSKHQQAACASFTTNDQLKNMLFDQAVGQNEGGRGNLDILADYSVARIEKPIVRGWDPALDITRCSGHLVVDIPPGAEVAFAGQRHLQADIDYTAQAAADHSGLVYQLRGAEPVVAKLASFNLTSTARSVAMNFPPLPPPPPPSPPPPEPRSRSAPYSGQRPVSAAAQPELAAGRRHPAPFEDRALSERASGWDEVERPDARSEGSAGEATVRAFYEALRTGDGPRASAQVVPEKRSRRAFSPEGLSSFYGRLADPLRLTDIVPAGEGAYRVRYRYSAGRTHCDGRAVVRLARRGDRDFIRSIEALSGC